MTNVITLLTVTAVTQQTFFLFKVNNGDIGKRCEICSKLTIKTPERRPISIGSESVKKQKLKCDVVLVSLL